MREQNVEKLFKDSFSNFEADVNPSVWSNIEQGLPSPQNIPGSSPVKPSGFFGKISLNTIVLVGAISATLIGSIVYLSSQKQISQDAVAQNIQQPQMTIKDNVAAPVTPASINHTTEQTKNIAAKPEVKNNNATGEKTIVNNKPVQSAPSQVKPENNTIENNTVTSSVPNSAPQVSSTVNPASEPVAAEKENNVVSSGKVSISISHHSQPSQEESPKVYGQPANEPSQTTLAPINAVPAETETSSESGQEFHFYIPNVFTPDGNMVNDVFQPIANNSLLKNYEMIIYDRYGFEIFRSQDFTLPWDGRLKDGNMAAEAVYVYEIRLTDFKDEPHFYIGHVALLR